MPDFSVCCFFCLPIILIRISYGCHLLPSPSTNCTLPPHACCCIKPHSKLSELYKCFLIDSNCAGTVGADIKKTKSTTFMNNAPHTQNLSFTECMGIINTTACKLGLISIILYVKMSAIQF